jgi:hypothetical protein
LRHGAAAGGAGNMKDMNLCLEVLSGEGVLGDIVHDVSTVENMGLWVILNRTSSFLLALGEVQGCLRGEEKSVRQVGVLVPWACAPGGGELVRRWNQVVWGLIQQM